MKSYIKVHKRLLAAAVSAGLLLSLVACGQLGADGQSSGNGASSSARPGGSEASGAAGAETLAFPVTWTYETGQRGIKSGELVCTVNSAHLIDSTDALPDTGGFENDAVIELWDGSGYQDFMYPEFIQEDSRFLPGAYMLLVDLTVTSKDAACYTRRDRDSMGNALGQFDAPYLFRADSLVYLLDLSPEAIEGQHGCYLLDYFSGMNQRAEHRIVFRLEPGESIDLTVGFMVSDSRQGGIVDLDSLYLTATAAKDASETLGRLDLSGEEVLPL